MISAVIQEDKESVGPLADGEVARLLSALHNAEFTRSNKHDLAKNSRFKQRSLFEIAAESKKRKDEFETDQQNLGPDIDSDHIDEGDFSNSKSDSLSKESLGALKTNESVPEQTVRDITSKQEIDGEEPEADVGVRGITTNSTPSSETDGKEPGIRGLTTNSISETDGTEAGIRGLTTNSTPSLEAVEAEPGIRGLTTNSTPSLENDEAEPRIRGLTSVQHDEIDASSKAEVPRELISNSNGITEQTAENSFETVNEAFERGKAEGVSEGRLAAIAETKEGAVADAKAELAAIVDTFKDVIDSLAQPKSIQLEALSNSISATILRLASQRAGTQIDELPEAFHDRIKALVTGIAHELAEGKVHLNEDDYATMKPYLSNLGYEVVVNSNLMRGDVTLKFDGVEVHDVAANRIAGDTAVISNSAADDAFAIDDNIPAVATDDIAATSDNSAADDAFAIDDNTAADDAVATDEITVVTDTAPEQDSGLKNLLTGDASLTKSDEQDQ